MQNNIKFRSKYQALGLCWNEVMMKAKSLGVWHGIVEGNLWADRVAYLECLKTRLALKLGREDKKQAEDLLEAIRELLK